MTEDKATPTELSEKELAKANGGGITYEHITTTFQKSGNGSSDRDKSGGMGDGKEPLSGTDLGSGR
jgi:hypothetical protein